MPDTQDDTQQTSSGRQPITRGIEPRRSIRGVTVAPHISSPPKRGSSVLHNIRGRSLPFSSHTRPPRVRVKSVGQDEKKTSPTRQVNSFTQTIRLSRERKLDSLEVLRQDSDRSCAGQQTSADSPRTDSIDLPRRSSYVLQITPPEIEPRRSTSPAKRLTASLKNFREQPTATPSPPGTIEGSPEKTKSFGGPAIPDITKYSSPTKKRDAFIVSLPPKPERQPSRLVTAITFFGYSLAPFYDFWERLQVSHCGQYSVERMLALDEYCQRVSIGRVLAICLLFPFGPLSVVVVTEFMPLQPVEQGPLSNYVFWIRHTIMGIILVMCAMWQAKAWIPEMAMTMKHVFVVAIGTACVYTATNILVSDLWVFPIPFLVVAGAPLNIFIWAVVSRIVLGSHPLEGIQDGEFRCRRFLLLTSVHASMLGIYPAYQAVFLALDGYLQLGMIALLPGINLALKNLQTALGSHLEDNLPELIIFSVDVFSAIYSVLCMHSASSMMMVAITLALHTSVLLLSLHGMNRRSRVARACRSFQLMERQQQNLRRRQSVLDSFATAGGSPALLSTLVNTMLRLLQAPGQLDSTEMGTIRLLSGMPHQLSKPSVDLLDQLAARCVYNNSRRTTEVVSVAQIKERYSSAAMEGRKLSVSHFPVPSQPQSKLIQRLRGAVLSISTIHGQRLNWVIRDGFDREIVDGMNLRQKGSLINFHGVQTNKIDHQGRILLFHAN
ncbi:Hypothetical protein PHPALM_18769, partial [Phytophthora palmivora]